MKRWGSRKGGENEKDRRRGGEEEGNVGVEK